MTSTPSTQRAELAEGVTYRAWRPFIREEYTPFYFDEEGGCTGASESTWVPKWRYEPCGPEDVEEVWDGEGEELRTVVSIHRPGRYPPRVFYTRQWRAPDGKVFGKTALRMTTTAAFRRWLSGEKWPFFSPAYEAHQAWAATLSSTPGTGAAVVAAPAGGA